MFYLHVCAACSQAYHSIPGSLRKSAFSFYHVGPGDWAQVLRFSGEHSDPLSHLIGSRAGVLKKLNYSWAARVPMWWCNVMSHVSNAHTMKVNKDDVSIRHSFPVLSVVTALCGAGCRTEHSAQHTAEFPVQLPTQVFLSKTSATSRCQLRKHELKL